MHFLMIARGGLVFVLAPAIIIGILLGAAIILSSNTAMLLTIPFGILFMFFIIFFRDPTRTMSQGVVSPADGKIVQVDEDHRQISIYMGLLDVHVNRAPWSGQVVQHKRTSGGYSRASTPAASDNYSLEWLFATLIGPIKLRQIAGLFARRIIPYIGEGASVMKGQRIGLIRFGSRVEVVLPASVKLTVKLGDRVRAGETKIAEVIHAS